MAICNLSAFSEYPVFGAVLWAVSGSSSCDEHVVYVAFWDKWVQEDSGTKSRMTENFTNSMYCEQS